MTAVRRWLRQVLRLLLVAGVALQLPGAMAARCQQCRRSAREAEPGCAETLDASQPVPKTAKQPHELLSNSSFSGGVPHARTDAYTWLRDDFRNVTAVLAKLKEENAYAEAVMAPSKPLQARLKEEMLARVPKEESSVPQRQGRHWYYSTHSEGKQYRRQCRRPIADLSAAPSEHDSMDLGQAEEVLLDEDELAAGHSYFDLRGLEVSPDEQLVAYGVDTEGSEVYTLFVRNLTVQAMLVDPAAASAAEADIPLQFQQSSGDFVFLDDSHTLLFTTQTSDTHRSDKLWRLDLEGRSDGDARRQSAHSPTLLHHEPDERFGLSLWRSRSDAVVYLQGSSETTHYLLYLPANSTAADNFTMLAPAVQEQQLLVRDWHFTGDSSDGSDSSDETGNGTHVPVSYLYAVIYTAEQRNGQLLVTQLAPNALLGAAADDQGMHSAPSALGGYWALLQGHSRDVEIVDLAVSASHLAVLERKNGTLMATAYPLPSDGSPLSELPKGQQFSFDAPSYALWFTGQGPFASGLLRVGYSSLTQPRSTYDINMQTGNRVLKQQQEVGGYDGTLYLSRLLWASSTDGVQVPISMAYRGDLAKLDGTDPLLLEAYGAYGSSYDPEFSGARLSLLDRGVVFAIAHVRGGGELGRYWYQEGKLLAKNHTFEDTIACAEFLIRAKYTSAHRLALWGRSAGGLTVGTAVNRRPDLCLSAILDVPFVDVVTTMSDPSLPLTVPEWEEWGNPLQDEDAYFNMLSYSPVDNVAAQPYPHLLLTAGLNDPRVSFWEPAKFAAKVRDLKTRQDSLVLLRTNMGAGHFAQSGLEDQAAETAFKFAFLLQTLAPCAALPGAQPAERCRGCFALFVAAATTAALVTLAVVLRPASRLRNWQRLGSSSGGRRGARRLSSGEDEDDENEDGDGYDTRLYASHASDREQAADVAAEAERQRRLRQEQLEQQGLSLAEYGDVRSAVRGKLQPIPPPPPGAPPASQLPHLLAASATAGPAGCSGSVGGGGSVELAQFDGSAGRALSAIPESPSALSSSSLM